MRNKYDKYNIGREVGRAVRRAVRSGNFEEIGRAVDKSVRKFTGEDDEDLRSGNDAGQRPAYTYGRASQDTRAAYREPSVRTAFRSRMPGGISGLVYAIVGASVGIPMLIADISVLMVGVTGYMTLSDFAVAFSVLIPITLAVFGMMGYGIALRRRARRFARYREAMGSAAFCTVAKLADTAGVTQERAKKDLKKMIVSGACPQGHLDRDETCFMVDDKTYGEYLEAERAYAARTEAARTQEAKQADPKEAELAAVREEGNGYLRQIRAANDALSGEVISGKLDRLENVTARIFECVRKHPEKLPDIRRFIRYYMPTTLKLVKSYEEFETQPVQGENITRAKEEIERALDTVNKAFENLLDALFADDALDVSADISTLETMLKQEGLTGSDFAKEPDESKLS
ncbi:5-bromo-4-chloroindolyl phosphate hydrolysis family protein [Caproiciproducens sp. CPB-2]|nr:5-bromo-4-chloroindolyl phosphate hydrolysis family protein [Caproiciproducens sp. CPB-2]MDF1493490.1 5-bromo-4-chloroindolyl phosphate hydrolysis family protein [Caproiciproducens sp. CPB-2]